ncbi:MAG: GWxTD domain-containing protein [candidate division WOR-3 bacterium]|nr:GWxTD domain-containing protein [candidate division WOR-3 bacterium]
MINTFLLLTIMGGDLYTKCYAFSNDYAEVWYFIPASEVGYSLMQDSMYNTYSYRIAINSYEQKDSVIREGIKGIRRGRAGIGDFILDCFPVFLFPGRFSYKLNVALFGKKLSASGEFEIISDTIPFYLSDLILGSKTERDTVFVRKGIKFTPRIASKYTNLDTLFSYIEIYGLVPDSLFYFVYYQIKDSLSQTIYKNEFTRLKYDYSQFDTLSISLWGFQDGVYQLIVEIFEPALNISAKRECVFIVTEVLPEIVDEPFAWEIKYLISEREYKKFLKMSRKAQIQYLKKFWSKRNYKEFKRRLIEVDAKFSTSFIKGRDTPMGRYYKNNGPPDEVYLYGPGVATRADIRHKGARVDEPQEVWIYETKGLQVIFKDINKDGVYELVRFAKHGDKEKEDYWQNREEMRRFLIKDD